jgi:hypothetical protein
MLPDVETRKLLTGKRRSFQTAIGTSCMRAFRVFGVQFRLCPFFRALHLIASIDAADDFVRQCGNYLTQRDTDSAISVPVPLVDLAPLLGRLQDFP